MNQAEILSKMSDCADFYRFLSDRSEATGSSEYGIENPSDYDRFCTKENFDVIVNEASRLGLEVIPSASAYACVERSANITIHAKTFHVFVIRESDLKPFRLATAATAAMCRAYPNAGSVKALRVQYFRSVKDMATMWGALVSGRMVVDVSKHGKAESA